MLRWGLRFFSEWEGIDDLKLIQMGKTALQAVSDGVLAMLTGSPGSSNATPSSAFIGGNSFRPVLVSGLGVSIKPGRAIYVRSEKESYTASSDMLGTNVVPLLLNSATTVTHDAHDATNPRWDIISVKYTTSAGTSATVYKRMAGAGSAATDTANTSLHYVPTFTITKGTPGASPSLPTAPTDGMVVAHVYVPATSGNVTVYDVRYVQRLGFGWADGPISPTFGQAFVQSGCTATAPGGMSVTIAAGTIYDGVATRTTEAATVTVSTAHATNPRIDLVYLDGGRVTYLAGTAASTPAAPALPSGTYGISQPLCTISVPALDIAIGSDQITDVRRVRPYTTAHVEEANPTAFLSVTVTAESANVRQISIQAIDRNRADLAMPVYIMLVARTTRDGTTAYSTGTKVNITGTEVDANNLTGLHLTDSTGLLEINYEVSGSSSVYLEAYAVDYFATSGGAAGASADLGYFPGGAKQFTLTYA